MSKRSAAGRKFPTWAQAVGAFAGIVTLLFFMAIVLLNLFGRSPGPDVRFPLIAAGAFGAAFAFAFLGGDAAAKGKLPIPRLNQSPMSFSIGGGAAVLVIMLFVGYWVSGSQGSGPNLQITVPDGAQLESVIRSVTGLERAVPRFDSTCEMDLLKTRVRGGTLEANTVHGAIRQLGTRLEGARNVSIRANRTEEGVYDIACESSP